MFESFLGEKRKTWFLLDGTMLCLDLRVSVRLILEENGTVNMVRHEIVLPPCDLGHFIFNSFTSLKRGSKTQSVLSRRRKGKSEGFRRV